MSASAGSHGVYEYNVATGETTYVSVDEYMRDHTNDLADLPGMIDAGSTPEISQRGIVGGDNRTAVYNPTGVQRTTCRIASRFDDGYLASGTGFLVNNKYVLTAGHLIYLSNHGGFPDHTAIYVGATNGNYIEYHTASYGSSYAVGGDYADNDDVTETYYSYGIYDDWGLVELDSPVTTSGLSYLGINPVNDAMEMQGYTYYTQGYPEDKNQGVSPWQNYTMYSGYGLIKTNAPGPNSISPRFLQLVYTDIDIVNEQSGSPVYTNRGYGNCAEGIIVSGTIADNLDNCILLITDWLYDYIDQRI